MTFLLQFLILLVFLAAFLFVMIKIMNREDSGDESEFVEDIYFQVPSVALLEVNRQTLQMFEVVKHNLRDAMNLFQEYDETRANKILHQEYKLNTYERKLSEYLTRIMSGELSEADNLLQVKMHFTVGNLEELGNYAVKLRKIAAQMAASGVQFSQSYREKLYVLTLAQTEMMELLNTAYQSGEKETFEQISALREVLVQLVKKTKEKSMEELKKKEVPADACLFFSCVLNDLVDIADLGELICGNIFNFAGSGEIKRYRDNVVSKQGRYDALVANYNVKYLVT